MYWTRTVVPWTNCGRSVRRIADCELIVYVGTVCAQHRCSTNWTNGRRTAWPLLQARPLSTHDHYALQTLVGSAMYAHTKKLGPGQVGAPLLVRCDANEVCAYAPPAWAVAAMPAMLRAMAAC